MSKPIIIQALSYGPEVPLLAARLGQVSAVLRNALYLQADNGEIVGVIGRPGGDGPISLRVRNLAALLAAPGLQPGTRFSGTGAQIDFSSLARIDLRCAAPWQPPQPQLTAAKPAVLAAASALRAALDRGPANGFAPLAAALVHLATGAADHSAPETALHKLAVARLAPLAASLRLLDGPASIEAAARLLGLGPGLTPSADDFLCGLLATACWVGAASRRAELIGGPLAADLLARAPASTTRLSARLLVHAATGLLYQPAMELGAALLGGRAAAVPAAAQSLFALGHTSGTDIACGLLFGVLLLGT